jgi:adenosine deaminase/aminodeoxyfutalosine deaminase
MPDAAKPDFNSCAAHASRTDPFLTCLPKAELHLHLEGSLTPDSLLEIAAPDQRERVQSWICDRQRENYRYGDFAGFIEAFKTVVLLLDSPAAYALATTRLIESLAAQNVRYAEITLSAGVILWKGQSVQAVFECVQRAAAEAEQRLGVRVNWIFDAVRQFGPEHARDVLREAARFRDGGVVAFGIGGDESKGPAAQFDGIYREARDLGFHVTAHAGETAGPESIRDAVEILGAERIGHGITAVRDPEVMALLRDRQVPVEVCLTSNVCTGLVANFRDHPLPQMLAAGLNVTVNSDDPGIFGTSLTRELQLAVEHYALSRDALIRLVTNAAHAAFVGEGEKKSLLKELQSAGRTG